MTVSILHISDLHRDTKYGISNGSLLQSLLNDRDRYTAVPAAIRSPDIAIVSGDLVQGVKPDHPNPETELDRQYHEAEEFLDGLAVELLDGDRERVVIIPGNHDISYCDVAKSLAEIPLDRTHPKYLEIAGQMARELFSPNSELRWNWNNLTVYRVTDLNQYNSRLAKFSEFYQRFYRNQRQYSLIPDEQFDIFSYPDLRIVVGALCSCCNNDPYRRAGCIHPDAIAKLSGLLKASQHDGQIPLAVWHHNTTGGPSNDDYMDAAILQVLIDCGFCIGFHGHQHRSELVDERFRFGSNRKITVVSAGTLCGGESALPHGQRRSYNIVELDTESLDAVVHPRYMANDKFDTPIWSSGPVLLTPYEPVRFTIQAPKAHDATIGDKLRVAEQLIADQEYDRAKLCLKSFASKDGNARRMLLECYVRSNYDNDFIGLFFPPRSLPEAVIVADALWELKESRKLKDLLSLDMIKDSSDPVAREIQTTYSAKLK